MSFPRAPLFVAFALLAMLAASAPAAEWQFSVAVGDQAGNKPGRAWLWIPPTCHRVRGVIWGNQVILEKLILDDPALRAAAARNDLALVVTVSTPLTEYPYNQPGVSDTLQKILDDLAAESGYDELSAAPLLPVGHSGAARFCWNLAYQDPARVIAIVPVHAAAIPEPPWDPKKTADGVPALCITGQYESWGDPELPLDHHVAWLRGGLLDFRARRKAPLVSMLMQPGGSHFGWDPPLAARVAAFIDAAAQARLPTEPTPPTTRPTLRRLDPATGTLTDIRFLQPPTFPPTPAAHFTGDPALAFWHLTPDLAAAADAYSHRDLGKLDQRLTFLVAGQPLPPAWLPDLPFTPDPDGVTVRVAAAFLTATPAGVAGSGRPLSHAPGPIKFRLLGGWGGGGEQTSPDTFRIRYDHFGLSPRTANLIVLAYHDGDAQYAYAEQPAQIRFPLRLTTGAPQSIHFPPLPDLPAGTPEIPLTATSDAGLPVSYFIRQGPAEIIGNRLVLTPLPPRTKYPVKLTLTAYQPGRPAPSPIRSATPIEHTFLLLPPEK